MGKDNRLLVLEELGLLERHQNKYAEHLVAGYNLPPNLLWKIDGAEARLKKIGGLEAEILSNRIVIFNQPRHKICCGGEEVLRPQTKWPGMPGIAMGISAIKGKRVLGDFCCWVSTAGKEKGAFDFSFHKQGFDSSTPVADYQMIMVSSRDNGLRFERISRDALLFFVEYLHLKRDRAS